MASPVDVPFPTSTNPGSAPGEGTGRLINCYAYAEGKGARWRAVPGLKLYAALPDGEYRGALLDNSVLYIVVGASVVQIGADGSQITLDGAVQGTGPVTMERNNALVPNVAITSSRANYVISGSSVQVFPDGNLPQANSVAFLDGYLIYTTASGDIWATDLNALTVNALSVARAEARPDGLLRGVVYGQQFFAMGTNTIEVWQDVGTLPFPLARVTVIPCGLWGPWAVAGSQDGWSGPLIFVAADGSVCRMDGYTPTRVSGEDLERLIGRVTDTSELVATVYTFGANSIWSLSSKTWTWQFNVTTGSWHERESLNSSRWRATQSIKAFGSWLFGDTAASNLLALDEDGLAEVGDPLIWGMDSGAVKQFPMRIAVPRVDFDFILGQAPLGGDASVMLSWSHDGGSRWATPINRSLMKQGRPVGPTYLQRLGLTTHAGVKFRFRISDPVYTSFAGARANAVPRRS